MRYAFLSVPKAMWEWCITVQRGQGWPCQRILMLPTRDHDLMQYKGKEFSAVRNLGTQNGFGKKPEKIAREQNS